MSTCPRCGAPDKYPNAPKTTVRHRVIRNVPTTYTCETVTSPDWSPPIYGPNCKDTKQ